MSSYKLIIPPMTIHFFEDYPMRKKPVMAVSFEGENCKWSSSYPWFKTVEEAQAYCDWLNRRQTE